MTKLDWDDEQLVQKFSNGYFRPDVGTHIVRVITSPHEQYVHWFDRKKIVCAEQNCPACKLANSRGSKREGAWPRFWVGVIDRSSQGATRTWDMNKPTFVQFVQLSKDPKWGNPKCYDAEVIVTKNGSGALIHTVKPLQSMPLTTGDRELIEEFVARKPSLKELTQTPSPETVQQELEKAGLIIQDATTVDTDFNFDDV